MVDFPVRFPAAAGVLLSDFRGDGDLFALLGNKGFQASGAVNPEADWILPFFKPFGFSSSPPSP
jgi:hypothetical protein